MGRQTRGQDTLSRTFRHRAKNFTKSMRASEQLCELSGLVWGGESEREQQRATENNRENTRAKGNNRVHFRAFWWYLSFR